jgi:hypothetical protein
LLGRARRPEIVEIDTIADDSHGNAGDQSFEILFLDLSMNQRMREILRNLAFIGEKPPLFDRVDPIQWYGRPFRVLPPFERVEIAEMHDPRNVGEVRGKLRHVAAVDDDQVGPLLNEFFLDGVMQLRLVQSRH